LKLHNANIRCCHVAAIGLVSYSIYTIVNPSEEERLTKPAHAQLDLPGRTEFEMKMATEKQVQLSFFST